jgi:hypothetical protein
MPKSGTRRRYQLWKLYLGALASINVLRESFGNPHLKATNTTEEKMQSQQNAGKLLCLMKRLTG